MNDEVEITNMLKDRDPRGLELAIKNYGKLVFTVIQNILQDATEQDIEDCSSDVFLALWQSAEQYDHTISSLKTWIIMISRRKAIDMYRSLCRKSTTMPLDENIQFKDMKPAEYVLKIENSIVLCDAIRKLNDTDRLLFYKRYYLCESCISIGRCLKQRPEAIRKRLWKIRQQLANSMNDKGV